MISDTGYGPVESLNLMLIKMMPATRKRVRCLSALKLPKPQYIFITASVSPHSPKLRPSKFLLHPWDTLTRNGLRCFPAPVNRLPACEGIDGFDIGCCLTQKRRRGPRDGPFLTLHIHHVGQSNEWDTGLTRGRARRKGERRCRGVRGEQGVSFHPCMWVEVTIGPPSTFSHLGCSIFNGLFCQAPSCSDC